MFSTNKALRDQVAASAHENMWKLEQWWILMPENPLIKMQWNLPLLPAFDDPTLNNGQYFQYDDGDILFWYLLDHEKQNGPRMEVSQFRPFRFFLSFQRQTNTGCLLNFTFIFDRYRRILAGATSKAPITDMS